MKKILKRIAIVIAMTLVLGTTGLAIAVKLRENRTFDAPYPEIHASTDPTVIERGRYLALGPAHCAACHAEPGQPATAEPHLAGGMEFDLPIGTYYTANITPDPVSGIGRYTDRELARTLRYGVHPSGRAMLPFMPFAEMADDDLTAVISYLRSRPPMQHAVPEHDVNLLGRFVKAFILEPEGPANLVPTTVAKGATVEYGKYLANNVANCNGCHTRRNMRTGAPEGEPFAGGMEIPSHAQPGTEFVTPNLTPDPTSGHIFAWSEDQFIARFRHAVGTASPMPWDSFKTMTDDDLRALYRYLRTLPPVNTRKGT